MLFRATRGNCYVRFSALSARAVDANGKHIQKVCFIIFYKSAAIEKKIVRICDAFGANRYDLSNLNRPHELDR
jgi:V-type H+-transporting ATPase subunit a